MSLTSVPTHILPPATIGIMGGGQLGMMTVREAQRMGYRTVIWDPDEHCPARRLADHVLTCGYDDEETAAEFAGMINVGTFEFENIPVAAVQRVERFVPVYPGSGILRIAQNRRLEKEELAQRGFSVTPFAIINSAAELEEALRRTGFPAVAKTTTAGYDGKGQMVLRSKDDLSDFKKTMSGTEWIVERFVELQAELSVIVARGLDGATALLPVPRNEHRANILHCSTVPAHLHESTVEAARAMARNIASSFDVVGVLCVEMFFTTSGELLVNELAPRPHNSGHFSLDACTISQFEMQVRAICNLPIPEPALISPCTMVNILGQHVNRLNIPELLAMDGIRLHLYGKRESRHGRKMGHITILGPTHEEVHRKTVLVQRMIGEEPDNLASPPMKSFKPTHNN